MASYDGEVVIRINLEDTEVDSKLGKLEQKTNSFSTSLKSLLSAVGITQALSKGFDLVRNSISSAMDRLDTMDQFNRVMTTMTGSSEIAAQALEEVRDTVTGTAYGLDVAASSVQKFVTSGMDISKATEQISIWGDAVAFYGKGTNESLQNVTDALSKMVAKGKVEMDQLNRLTDEGIPAVQIFADYVGRSMEDVQNDLSNGKISADEFVTVLGEAMTNGTSKFASIAGAAQEAGSSWSGTIDNMKAAITRGMTDIIESIDSSLESMGLPTMKEMIAEFGSSVEDIMGDVADAIPGAIEAIGELINKLQELSPIIVGVTAAFVAFKTAMTISSLLTTLTTGFSLLSTVISNLGVGGAIKMLMGFASPATLAVTAITGIVAAIVYLWNTSEGFREFWTNVWNSIVNFLSGAVDSIVGFFTKTIPQAWDDFKQGVQDVVDTVVETFQDFIDSIAEFFTVTIPEFVQGVIEWFNQLPYNIGLAIGQIIGYIANLGLRLVEFITVDIPNFINGIITWFSQLPANVWIWLTDVINKIITWGSSIYTSATTWVSNTINGIVTWFSQLPGNIWAWLTDAVGKVGEWGSNMLSKGKEAAKQVVDGIVEKMKELPGQMIEIGKQLIQGLWDGIVSVKDWIFDKIGDFGNGIIDGFKSVFGINSPSRIMRDMIGKFLPPGIAVGFEMAMPDTEKQMSRKLSDLNTTLSREADLSLGKLSAEVEYKTAVQAAKDSDFRAYIANELNIDYDKLGNATAKAIRDADITLELNNREIGRIT